MKSTFRLILMAAAGAVLMPSSAAAHCDALDGPVVKAAMAALDKGDVTVALKWVAKEHEAEARALFDDAVAVRGSSAHARAFADRYFAETLVRLHRQGEGEPYTGLKAAGSIDPGIAAADAALDAGRIDPLIQSTTREIAEQIRRSFSGVERARGDMDRSIEAGRAYVAEYVQFIHYVEALQHLTTENAGHQHQP